MHDEIGIGAQERQAALGDPAKASPRSRRASRCRRRTGGAQHVIGAFEIDEPRRRAGASRGRVEQRQVALGADMMNRRRDAFGHRCDRHVARSHDRVEGVGRKPEPQHLLADRRVRPRRIGEAG